MEISDACLREREYVLLFVSSSSLEFVVECCMVVIAVVVVDVRESALQGLFGNRPRTWNAVEALAFRDGSALNCHAEDRA